MASLRLPWHVLFHIPIPPSILRALSQSRVGAAPAHGPPQGWSHSGLIQTEPAKPLHSPRRHLPPAHKAQLQEEVVVSRC